MRILKLEREKVLPKADYIFEKKSDFLKLVPYIRKKIEGEWCIILLDFKYTEIEEIIQMDIPEYANLTFYTPEDTRDKLSLKYPKLVEKNKTKHELYLEYMSTIDKNFSVKAVNEIYSRNSGNLTEIKSTVEKLLGITKELNIVDVSDVDKIIEKDDKVYARDVVLSYLLDKNYLVPKKGSRLSRYKYTKKEELRDKYLDILDRKVAFYACRKFLKYLYDEKVAYLNGKESKEEELLKIVDYYEIAHAYFTFRLSTPSQFEICLVNMDRRKENDSIFIRTILGIDT